MSVRRPACATTRSTPGRAASSSAVPAGRVVSKLPVAWNSTSLAPRVSRTTRSSDDVIASDATSTPNSTATPSAVPLAVSA
jgi:hypothetical protein